MTTRKNLHIDIDTESATWQEVRRLEEAVHKSDGDGVRARWDSGRYMLTLKKGKQLPRGVLNQLAKTLDVSRAEVTARMKFATKFPTEDELPDVIRKFPTWYITGWRIKSEVLPLEWRQVDFASGEIRLDPGTTKNGDGRVVYMTAELRTLLKAREVERDRLKKTGVIVPWVFFREIAEGRGGEKKPRRIGSFTKAWKSACAQAGCPGRIPHDLRRTAIRNLVRAGIPERVAMRMTGHKTASVFQRYNIVSDGDLREAARKLDAAGSALR